MHIEKVEKNGQPIAVVTSDELLIFDGQSAGDFIMNVQALSDCYRAVVKKEAIAEEFFALRSGLAGEVLQKFVNYHMKLAIVGDFSGYSSKALQDFIYESNKGNSIFFVPDESEALQRLSQA